MDPAQIASAPVATHSMGKRQVPEIGGVPSHLRIDVLSAEDCGVR